MQVLRQIISLSIIIFLLAACSANSEGEANIAETVSLNWILADDEVLAYSTAMNAIQDTEIQFQIGSILNTEDEELNDALSAISGMNLPESGSMISVLSKNEQGNIAIKMILHEVTFAENDAGDFFGQAFNDMMEQMQGTVQLRGAVQPDGAVASFYLENRQRNLISLFFELPTTPVRVGDTWQLDFNCISMGATFIAENAHRVNQVTLTDLTETDDGRRIAVLDYVLIESVDGVFGTSLSDDGSSVATSMTCSYIGRGHFLIDEGRWQQLVGEFSILSAGGLMNSNVTQRLALAPLDNLPDEYRNLR